MGHQESQLRAGCGPHFVVVGIGLVVVAHHRQQPPARLCRPALHDPKHGVLGLCPRDDGGIAPARRPEERLPHRRLVARNHGMGTIGDGGGTRGHAMRREVAGDLVVVG
jgi:hypothetical protein